MINKDYEGENLVFIIGCPRSGTTWLQRLLACHPRVRTGQESNLFSDYVGLQLRRWMEGADPENRRGGIGMACYFTRAEFLEISRSLLRRLLEPLVADLAPGELFIEKTPAHGLYLPEIIELLPASRIIHIKRDPRDVVSSLLAASRSWGSNWAPGSSRAAALMWVNYLASLEQAKRSLSPQKFHELSYETLAASGPTVLQGCARFLGLEWSDEQILKAIAANRISSDTQSAGTPIPLKGEVARRSGPVVIEPQGFIRRAAAGGWRSDLNLWDRFWVWKTAHAAMDAAGYSWRSFTDS